MAGVQNILQRLGGDQRGTSVLELGLALPILSLMLAGLIDVARVYSAQVSLQQAAARSLERLQVHGYPETFEFVMAEAAAAAGVPASDVAITGWLECDNVRQPAGTIDCSGTQVAGKYVQVTITSTHETFFSFSPVGTRNADGNVDLSASSAVRYG